MLECFAAIKLEWKNDRNFVNFAHQRFYRYSLVMDRCRIVLYKKMFPAV